MMARGVGGGGGGSVCLTRHEKIISKKYEQELFGNFTVVVRRECSWRSWYPDTDHRHHPHYRLWWGRMARKETRIAGGLADPVTTRWFPTVWHENLVRYDHGSGWAHHGMRFGPWSGIMTGCLMMIATQQHEPSSLLPLTRQYIIHRKQEPTTSLSALYSASLLLGQLSCGFHFLCFLDMIMILILGI